MEHAEQTCRTRSVLAKVAWAACDGFRVTVHVSEKLDHSGVLEIRETHDRHRERDVIYRSLTVHHPDAGALIQRFEQALAERDAALALAIGRIEQLEAQVAELKA